MKLGFNNFLHTVIASLMLSSCDINLEITTSCDGKPIVDGQCLDTTDFLTQVNAEITVESLILIKSNAASLTNVNPIEISLMSETYDEYQYKFVSGDQFCESSGYGSWHKISEPITKEFSEDATHRICVLGRETKGENNLRLENQTPATETWTLDTSAPIVTLTNSPLAYSRDNELGVLIDEVDTVD